MLTGFGVALTPSWKPCPCVREPENKSENSANAPTNSFLLKLMCIPTGVWPSLVCASVGKDAAFGNADVAAQSIENMGMKVMIIFFRSGYVEIDATTGPYRHTPNGYTRVVKLYPVTIWDMISCGANVRHRG